MAKQRRKSSLKSGAKRKGRKLRRGSLKGGKNQPFRGKRGTGTRFKNCVATMSRRKGVTNPRALCGAIKRAKYG